MDILSDIQVKLKVPKTQFNAFGKYHYRTCEDILEAVKPHLESTGTHLLMTDDIVFWGERYYVRAIVILMKNNECLGTGQGMAREADQQKGMQEAQLSGSTSSYARKTALGGLFALDDTKDADGLPDAKSDYITKEQLNQITDMINAVDADEGKFLSYLKVDSLDKIPAVGFEKAMAALKAKEKKSREPGEEG